MHDQWDDSPEGELLRSVRSALQATPAPDLAQLHQLIERLAPLVNHSEALVAAQARQLELRALGAMFTAQAAAMRGLAQQLQQVAHWLPPERAEQN
jgi:hypothetical protein